MKKVILLATMFVCFLSSGCSNLISDDTMETPNANAGSSIMIRATTSEMAAANIFDSKNARQHVFSGNDILWFNVTTRELRFKDNFSIKQVILQYDAISFFIQDEYLFSSMVYVSSRGIQLINNLVLYYNLVENKYYLLDGYPDHNVLANNESQYNSLIDRNDITDLPQYVKDLRAENALKIVSGWEKFISQLKKEGLLK